MSVVCPSCGEPAPDGANWCEACGSDLAAPPAIGATPDLAAAPCVACEATEIDTDGYCMECGHKQPAARDHVQVTSGPTVGRSDRGRRHYRNEDAVSVGHRIEESGVVRLALVVCDGVSSTPGSAAASEAAAEAAVDALLTPTLEIPSPDSAIDRHSAAADAMRASADAAQQAAASAPEVDVSAAHPPSSTFVAAVVSASPNDVDTFITVGWIGDSRAYWIGSDPAAGNALLLTHDHETNGSLTRWIGADAVPVVPDDDPLGSAAAVQIRGGADLVEVVDLNASGPGTLVVCSDGLWRYADDAEAMASLVRRVRNQHEDLGDVAEELIAFANAGGGHDNISVALCAFPLSTPAPADLSFNHFTAPEEPA